MGENLGVTCGNILGRSYELLSELQPEGYLVLGDTNSCLSAISAKRLHIPLFHMEAGNRCKDECLPEETNRRIVDVISDVNMCYSEFARKYLADTGLPKERTYQTGSPMAEVLHMNLEKIQRSDVLERLGLEKDKYILLSAHREENIDSEKNFLSLFTAINALAEKYDMPILYSCHPRSRNRLEATGFTLAPRVRKALVSGYLYGVDDSLLHLNGNCSCNYTPGLWRLLEMGDIASLVAPRPLLVQSCEKDHLNGARGLANVDEQLDIVRDAYALLGKDENLLHEVCPG